MAQIDAVTQENAPRTSEASLANMRAQREEKQATLVLNEQTLARQRTMVSQKAVSQADFEVADAAVKVTRAQLAALEAQIVAAQIVVDTARAVLGYTRITAPIDGTVLALVAQEGQTVNASQSAPTIVILGQLDVMTVRAEISEADIVKVAPGMPLWFTVVGAPEERHKARLAFIEPAPESIKNDSSFATSTTSSSSASSSTSSAVYYIGVFDVPNPKGRLRTDMTAEVHIVLGRAAGVLTVPATALVRAGKGYHVRVLKPDGTVDRRIEVGLNDKITAEIRSGLEDGEKVVTGEAMPGDPGGRRVSPRGRGRRATAVRFRLQPEPVDLPAVHHRADALRRQQLAALHHREGGGRRAHGRGRAAVTRFLTQRHGTKDFFIINTDDIRNTITATTETMTVLIAAIAVISLIVGGIGVMNIMLVSVSERVGEIGVRMAVGARRSDILNQFLIEAALVCLVGGVAGIALAFGVAFAYAGSNFTLVYSATSIVAAVLCSSRIGVGFGYLPARNASRLDPVTALARD
ncbi:efflux RND transporter periplasmic adaptor subunit [Xanthobacter dioxanivorans]|uniref:Efflux RND transporter periplasmic adaptor subunit n=1 Tax=Xanthobacter dioxanivorans TaxID=2528964 RepID=A0A974PUH0_9HYPH|nr:efflux RND transporter periplasmic adaptor subunit [Xanthobacter dioxanivorans]